MKKFLPYILILTVIMQLFAPFSVGMGKNNSPLVKTNKAEAVFDRTENGIGLSVLPTTTDKSINLEITVTWTNGTYMADQGVRVIKTDPSSGNKTIIPLSSTEGIPMNKKSGDTYTGSVSFDGLNPGTDYPLVIEARQINRSVLDWNPINNTSGSLNNPCFISNSILGVGTYQNMCPLWDDLNGTNLDGFIYVLKIETSIPTNKEGETNLVTQNQLQSKNEAAMLPTCGLSNLGGCVGIVLYRLIFQPTAYVFGLLGRVFDYTFAYSIKDSSYRSQFVVEGWGLMRDICNMFFIFILLYIAIGTILKLHGVKPQEMIINVVIIGLLINFSLFACQVIIDASNILSRVFYSQIVVGQKVNGEIVEELGETYKEKKVSEALISKINPQQVLLSAEKASQLKTKGSDNAVSNGDQQSDGVDVVTFIFVTILASFMNVVGIIVFLSVSLIFIARVIGLWIAMILAPVAFFTYTIPKAKSVDTIGWEKWWPNTINLAFLAPVFIFFIYLIIKFLETGLGMGDASTKTGLDFYIAVLVPFAFLMVLLMKAKSIATKMSGELGQSITKGIAALGGVLLGGAALGVAALGRGTIGAVAKYTQNDNARGKDQKLGSNVKDIWKTAGLNPLKWVGATGKTFKAAGKAGAAWSAEGLHILPTTQKDASGNRLTVGKLLQEKEKIFREKGHGAHTLDAQAQETTHNKDAKYSDLTETEQNKVKDLVDRDELAKYHYGASFDKLDSPGKAAIQNSFDAGDRIIEDETKNGKKGLVSKNTVTGVKEVNYKDGTPTEVYDHKNHHDMSSVYEHHMKQTGTELGEFSTALRKSTYDLRNISKLTTSSKGFAKFGVGLAATLATGVRMGLKGSGVEHGTGTGKGNLMKDLGSVISESLKSMKVDVKVDHGGGGHGKVSGGHGGGHH